MNYKFLPIVFFSLIIIGSIGCQGDQHYTEEFIEVYEVDKSSSDRAQGTLQFKESYVYDQNNKKIAHGIYNNDNTLKGIENYIYKDVKKPALGSEYIENDKLLSYYKFEYDQKDKKILSYSFDGISDELLRKEEFGYDENGNQNMKVIKTAQDSIAKIFEFGHDDSGNETSVTIYNGGMQVLTKEDYEIISKNEKGEWTEKYGYVNNKLTTYRKRYWRDTKKK